MLYFDADAYAEGICNSAPTGAIDSLLDLLEYTATTIIDDAIQYRRSDDDDDDAIADNEQVEGYDEIAAHLLDLRDAIKKYEANDGEEEPDERYTVVTLDNGVSYEIFEASAPMVPPQKFAWYSDAEAAADKLNATN
jgi:hypothetical protein